MIARDYHAYRLSSARSNKTEAEEVFADCMAVNGYVYMYSIDAEQLHNDVADGVRADKTAADRAAEIARIATEKKTEEYRAVPKSSVKNNNNRQKLPVLPPKKTQNKKR